MKVFMVWVSLFAFFACADQRPMPRLSSSTASPATSTDPTPTPTPTPTSVPVTEPKPTTAFLGRTRATTTELTAARDLYTNECSICHSALAVSTKRSVTVPRLNAACVTDAVPLHKDILRRQVWPKDVLDDKNDGVDTAQLNASALAEVLK